MVTPVGEPSPPPIRTPDQRLRVFVSSTLRELAEERRAAREAIERLHLAPVMFELGARPHPPRSLYRSYLAQSDVFVGIYAESYGWVAPDEEVSGLEDEYNLAPASMPKLIYIKAAEDRDERLSTLIDRIRNDDTAAYLPFRDAAELGDRVRDDLATLLAERFDQSRMTRPESPAAASAVALPVPYTTTIGREQDLRRVRELLETGADRVVSLIGPGGIGKSRLAIEVAHATEDLFPDGIYFVPLEGVLETGLLLPTIAYFLGVRDTGDAALEERIARVIADKRVLIVLDNFEQIVDAAPVLVNLYNQAPRATFLVTSRIVLRIRGERVYEVQTLPVPADGQPAGVDRALRSPAVALFVDRARAVRPEFAVTPDNVADIADICRRLDGLPLAIELAAAKVRVLSPAGIAQRLERSLPLLTAASRDLPERHRTMAATIDWSVSLLTDVQRALLEDLGVFARRFSLDAVEAVGAGRSWDGEAVDALGALIDASLVTQADIGGRSTFSLLAIVREYALDRLKMRHEAGTMRNAHADYYLAFVRRVSPELRGAAQADAVRRLELELPNLRAAVRHLVYMDRLDDAGEFAWSLLSYWWISGYFSEVRLWMLELLDRPAPITAHTRGVAVFFTMWGEMWRQPSDQVIAGLGESVRLFTESGDANATAMALAARGSTRMRFPDLDMAAAEAELQEAAAQLHALDNWWGEAMAEIAMGLMALARRDIADSVAHTGRAASIAEAKQDVFLRVVAGNNVARLAFFGGDVETAAREYGTTLALAARLHYEEGAQYALEGMSAIAGVKGDAWRAGALSAAAEAVRQRVGLFDVDGFAVNLQPLAALRSSDPAGVAAGEKAGAAMSIAEAIAMALPDADRTLQDALAEW
jgi:predicted ATPase